MKVTKFKIWLDEDKITVRIQILKKLNEEDLFRMIDIVNEITEDIEEPNILIDMTQAPEDVVDEGLISNFESILQPDRNQSVLSQASNVEEIQTPKVFRNRKEAMEWLKGD